MLNHLTSNPFWDIVPWIKFFLKNAVFKLKIKPYIFLIF